MVPEAGSRVYGLDGLRGVVETARGLTPETVLVHFGDGTRASVPAHLLVPKEGGYGLGIGVADLARLRSAEEGNDPAEQGRKLVIPVIEENLEVGKRIVETGRVRVSKRVEESEQTIDESLFREEVEVERVATDRFVEQPPGITRDSETLIVPIVEEVLVVQRRLRVKEELRITRRRAEEHRPQRHVLRKEVATVERLEPEGSGDAENLAT